jgi:predicted RNA-binding Zn ribbon-like protein
MDGHPVDSHGLMLPEPSWPDDPGSAAGLESLRRFCNTTNRENGADAWRTPAELRAWLVSEGAERVGSLDASDLARLVALRDALWSGVRDGDFGPFARIAGDLAVTIEAGPHGVAVVPARSGVDGVVARLALAVAAASATGELRRLKACQHCRWVFHDTSKNRRGRWCSMAACGSRDKARSYRRRQAGRRAERRP